MHSLSASFGSSPIIPTTASNSFLKYKWQEIKLQPKFQRTLNSFLDRNPNPNTQSGKRSLSQYIDDLESTSPSKSLNAFQSQCSLIQGQKYSTQTLESMIKKNEEILLRQSYEIAGLRDLLQQALQMYQGESYNNHNNNNNHNHNQNQNQNQNQNDNGFFHSSLRTGRTNSMTNFSSSNNVVNSNNNFQNKINNINNNLNNNNNNTNNNANTELLALKQTLEQEQQKCADLQQQLEEKDANTKKFQNLAQQLQDQLNDQPDTKGLQEEVNLWKKKYIDLNRTLNQTQTQLMMAETELQSLKTKQQSEQQIKLSRQSSIQSPDTIARSNNRRRTTTKLADPQQQLIQVQQ